VFELAVTGEYRGLAGVKKKYVAHGVPVADK
jgi:hypothetical protein